MLDSPEALLARLNAVDPKDEEAVAEAVASMSDLNDRIGRGVAFLTAMGMEDNADNPVFIRALDTYAGLCDVKFAIDRIINDRDAESVAKVRLALMRRILDEADGSGAVARADVD